MVTDNNTTLPGRVFVLTCYLMTTITLSQITSLGHITCAPNIDAMAMASDGSRKGNREGNREKNKCENCKRTGHVKNDY